MTLTTFALAAALQAQTYELKWQPKRGETHVYEFFLTEKDTGVEASLEHKITEVKGDGGYTVQSRSLGAIVKLAGGEIRDDRPNEATATYDAFGRLVDIKGGSTGLEKYRHALLTKFVAPPKGVEVGAKWSYERGADKPKGLAAFVTEYTLKEVSGGLAVVTFVMNEKSGPTPQSATGTWWIDTKTGLAQKLEAKVKNFVGQESGETEVRLALRKPL